MKRRDRLAARRRDDARAARAEARALRARLEAMLGADTFAEALAAGGDMSAFGVRLDDHAGGDDCPLCRMLGDTPTETTTLPDGSTISISFVR